MIKVTRDPIVPGLVIDSVRGDSGHGAAVSFIGSLRASSADGRQVRFAECKSDEQGLEQQLQQIGKEILAKWQLKNAAICHRVGRIEVGDVIMVVAIAAPHRQEAFEACQYAVDRAKESILIEEIL